MSQTLRLLQAIDELYDGVSTAPEQWRDQSFEDWASDLAAEGLTKEEARAVRRVLNMAMKLRDFWAAEERGVDASDWRSRVDVAYGARAWRPTLELAMHGLETEPSPELFAEVKQRFRIVYSEAWMDGVDYEEWVARSTDS